MDSLEKDKLIESALLQPTQESCESEEQAMDSFRKIRPYRQGLKYTTMGAEIRIFHKSRDLHPSPFR